MASEASAPILAAAGLWADPYFWSTAAALFTGLAAGQFARGAGGRIRGEGEPRKAVRRRARRFSRAIAFLSLGILSLAGLLVLADKTSTLEAGIWGGEARLLGIWALLVALLACLAGLYWLKAGLPLAALGFGILCLLGSSLRGWTPLRLEGGTAARIATFLPYELGPKAFRGHLELAHPEAGSTGRELGLDSTALAISVEELSLRGPLAFLAALAAAPAQLPAPEPLRFYQVTGMAGPGAAPLEFPDRVTSPVVGALLPLSAEAGEPGGSPVSRSTAFGLALRTRQTSQARSLVALEPVEFFLDGEGKPTPR
jgi:hypothetical protein